jgi:hypothetical protein
VYVYVYVYVCVSVLLFFRSTSLFEKQLAVLVDGVSPHHPPTHTHTDTICNPFVSAATAFRAATAEVAVFTSQRRRSLAVVTRI